ncbi:MAG: hypothetical protein RLZ57_162 [Actinomycetota bacterium]|jgi:FkbM family methyltransferase
MSILHINYKYLTIKYNRGNVFKLKAKVLNEIISKKGRQILIYLIKINNIFSKYYPVLTHDLESQNPSLSEHFRLNLFKQINFESRFNNLLFIDIGANIGQEIKTISEFAKLKKFDYKILSFEPVPELFNFLQDEYSELIDEQKLEIFQCAIGKSGTRDLYLKNEDLKLNDGSSLISKKTNTSKYRIQVITKELDWFLSRLNLNNFSHKILKIDAEGSEYEILQNLINKEYIQIFDYIFVEDHFKKIKSISWQIHRLLIRRKLSIKKIVIDNW